MAGVQGFVQNILHGGIGTTELLNSYVRGDDTDDEEPEPQEKGKSSQRTAITVSAAPPILGSLLGSNAPKRDIYSPIRKDSSNENEVERQQMIAEHIKLTGGKKGHPQKQGKRGRKKGRPRKKRAPRCEELYTDKDRAAAVNMGSKDIKQSLSLKLKQDRSKALQIPEEAEPGTFLALGSYEMKCGDVSIARGFLSKALEMNEDDKEALLARSKCHIMLGDAKEALDDASNALKQDKNDTEAIYQKAEALYALGQFEHSLMYYHRGLRIRPEMVRFQLGVQKAQQAIINSIGAKIKLNSNSSTSSLKDKKFLNPPSYLTTPGISRRSSAHSTYGNNLTVGTNPLAARLISASTLQKSNSSTLISVHGASSKKKNLGPLSADRVYLENLLMDPDITCLDKENKDVITKAEEALSYLKKRQIFWEQQLPTSGNLMKRKTSIIGRK